MNTNELIERLANELAVVRPLKRPARRAAPWLIGSVLYLGGLTLAVSSFSLRADGPDSGVLISQLIGVVAGILAAIAAFASVVPGYSKRVLISPSMATLAWLVAFVFVALEGASDGQSVVASRHEWVCVAVILLGGGPLVAALAVMLGRGAPLNPVLTAMLGALAVGLLANFSACVALPHADGAVTLVWHGAAVIVLGLVCAAGARFVLTWGPR